MNKEERPHLAQMQIQTQAGLVPVAVKAGSPIFILGRNGAGKSALINQLAAQWTGSVVYLPGSRPSYFDSESLSMTPAIRSDENKRIRSSSNETKNTEDPGSP